ncbi:hypothetical protein SDC9_193256 [bioreactor metagenome]|uniref:Uncharacterized protein n=1 Tax=bioreactor metagenome TaxID=1076179 RepID=A0A645I308_9ZZZZ
MPMTPPLSAQALKTSSGFNLFISHNALAPIWLMNMGLLLAFIVSIAVLSPVWDTSIAIPTLFMRSTAWRPKAVRPPSFFSFRPEPKEFDSLYAIPIILAPRPYNISILSSSFSIIVALSREMNHAIFPSALAL